MKPKLLLLWLFLSVLLTSCQLATTLSPPEIEYQDVSLSQSSVKPEEQLALFAYDQQAPLEVQEVDRWQEQGITYIDLTYASPTGNRVPATLVLPRGPGPSAGLVVQHGMPSNRQAMVWVAQAYAQMGAVVVMIDAPWARPERQECEDYACKTVPRFTKEDRADQIELMLDLQRAVDLLLSRPEVDPQRLAYIGVSYGGAMGGLLAGIEQRLQAYVLVVGDGGLVEHTSEPDADGYPDHWSKNWVDAMWPIEPLHYVGRASPAALLFQNGTQDNLVPRRDALRYQQAGSQPKTVMWYEAGHGPTPSSLRDQSEWLHQTVGAESLFILRPHFSASTIWLDRLLGLWLLLVIVSMVLLILDAALGTPWTAGSLLSWILVMFFFGPLGLLIYFFTWRQSLRVSPPDHILTTTRRALGATSWSAAGVLLGAFIATAVVLSFIDFFASQLILNIVLSMGMPFLSAILLYLVVRVSTKRAGRRFNLRWSPLALFVSVCVVIAGSYPLVIILNERWLAWFFPYGWTSPNLLVWIILFLGALCGSVFVYPVQYWLVRRGMVVWQVPVPLDEDGAPQISNPASLSWFQAVGVIVLALAFMLAGMGLAVWTTQ